MTKALNVLAWVGTGLVFVAVSINLDRIIALRGLPGAALGAIVLLVAVLVPLSALALGVRREMQRRLTGEYEARVIALATVMEAALQRESATVASRLDALRDTLPFTLAVEPVEKSSLCVTPGSRK